MLAVANDRQFANLCRVLGLPDMPADPRYATNRARMANRDTLLPALQDALRTRPAREWMDALNAVGVASGPINDVAAVQEDPQIRHRGVFRDITTGSGEAVPCVANPIRFSETPVSYRHPPPALGAHQDEVLRDWLGVE